MNLKQRIWMLPILTAAIFTLGAGSVAWISRATSSSIHSLGASDYPYLETATKLAQSFDSFGATVQSAAAEGDAKRLDDADAKVAAMKELAATMHDLAPAPTAAGPLPAMVSEYADASMAAAKGMIAGTGDPTAMIARMQGARTALDARIKDIRRDARAAVETRLAAADKGVVSIEVAMFVCALAVLGVLGGVSMLLVRSIWSQLGGEPAYARKVLLEIAGGNLGCEVKVEGASNTSLLAAVRDMANGLSSIVLAVRRGSDSMAVASREIAVGSQDLSVRTERTASSLQQTSASVDQLAGAVNQTAASARGANELAGSASAVAGRGGAVVAQVVSTMTQIDASARRIADITGVIDGIAFQTNILALNAAVEAARAGEQGRGFAVVAAEVRSLAQRAAGAAKEIKSLIGDSVDKVEVGMRLVKDAGATMDEIVGSVKRVTDIIAEISTAASEQDAGVGSVNRAVSSLDEMTQQNAALVEESAAAAESLQGQAAQLTQLVSTFQLRES